MKHFFIVYTHQSLLLHMRGKTEQETTLEYISIPFNLNPKFKWVFLINP